jgi:hypothetical protein
VVVEALFLGVVSEVVGGLAIDTLHRVSDSKPSHRANPDENAQSAEQLGRKTLAIELLALEVNDATSEQVFAFLDSAEGLALAEQTVKVAIGTAHEAPPGPLVQAANAFLSLWFGDREVANVLTLPVVNALWRGALGEFQRLSISDAKRARTVRTTIETEVRAVSFVSQLGTAAGYIAGAVRIEPERLLAAAQAYGSRIAESAQFANIEVPSLGAPRSMPAELLYVPPSIRAGDLPPGFATESLAGASLDGAEIPLVGLCALAPRAVMTGDPGGG